MKKQVTTAHIKIEDKSTSEIQQRIAIERGLALLEKELRENLSHFEQGNGVEFSSIQHPDKPGDDSAWLVERSLLIELESCLEARAQVICQRRITSRQENRRHVSYQEIARTRRFLNQFETTKNNRVADFGTASGGDGGIYDRIQLIREDLRGD